MIILSVDYGDVRTGIALCDSLEILASPVCVITERNQEKLVDKIKSLVIENNAEMIVIGNPRNMDGSSGFRSDKCVELAEKVKQSCVGIETVLWDERMTTMAAHQALNATDTRGKRRKEIIDAVSATMILQSFLEYRKNTK